MAAFASTATAARRLRDAIEPLATIGYHAPPAQDALADLGFDFLRGYVWTRGSSLGEPEAAVVVSSFGAWQPDAVEQAWRDARAVVDLADIRRIRLRGVEDSLRAVLGDTDRLDGLQQTVTALEDAVGSVTTLGRPIFAGLTAHPRPDDLLGRLWHATNQVRERRGDSHLAALVGAGIDGVQSNLLNELWHGYDQFVFTETRRWTTAQMTAGVRSLEHRGLVADGALTDAGRALRVDLEARTDVAEQDLVDALDDVETHIGRIDGWSQRIVDRGWYPDDPDGDKRHAG